MIMQNLFPASAHLNRVTAMIRLVREHDGSMDISMLANEIGESIDSLFPVIEACRMLGLCTTKRGTVSLTKAGLQTTSKNVHEMVGLRLPRIEPFKTIFSMFGKQRSLSTTEIEHGLNKKSITVFNPSAKNETAAIRELLLVWALNTKLLKQDAKNDRWARR